MDITNDIHDLSWAAFSHEDLYRMVRTEAPGPAGMIDTDQAWTELIALLRQSRQKIDALLREAGASWEGLAADAMRDGVTPLAQWADDIAAASTATATSVRTVAEWFAFTANQMPEPVPVTSTANAGVPAKFTHLFGGQTDQDLQERAAQEAKQRAVELMASYSTLAGDALGNVGTFTPPQAVTVAVRPPQAISGPVTHEQGAFVTPPPPVARGAVEPGGRTVPTPPPTSPEASPPASPGPAPVSLPGARSSTETRPAATVSAAAPAADTGGSDAFAPRIAPGAATPGSGSGSARQNGQPFGGVRPPSTSDTAPRIPGLPRENPPPARSTGAGVPLVPGAAAPREEDDEHQSPGYLQAYHDEYWEGGQRVSPPVLGAEESEG